MSENQVEQKSDRLKSRLDRLVTRNEIEPSSRRQRAVAEAKERKRKAETGQHKQDMQYLLTPYLEDIFLEFEQRARG